MEIRIFLTLIFVGFLPVFGRGNEEQGQGGVRGVYETLQGFIGELGKVTRDVTAGIHKLGKGIKTVQDFLDATVEEDCNFECPNG